MTELVTLDYKSPCKKCSTNTFFLYSHEQQLICQKCLAIAYNGFPCGKGCLVACRICQPPEIRWFFQQTYGDIATSCWKHATRENNDEDYAVVDLFQ